MNEIPSHPPHWLPGSATVAAERAQEDRERFVHIAYGELVKHFGLGTTHTFSPWNQLPPEERDKWTASLTRARESAAENESNDVSHAEANSPRQ